MDYRKLKGNLGLKSSALAPTACKLSSQFLVLDHMCNHYMKIARAKSAIDSRLPKSLVSSQKMRDRMNRDRVVQSPQLRSHTSMSGVNVYEYEDVLKDEPEDEEEKLVHSIMRSTLLDKSGYSNIATHGSSSHMVPRETHTHLAQQVPEIVNGTHYTLPYGTMTYDQPDSVRSVKSGHSLASSASRVAITTTLSAKRACKGDVLEKRPHLFTEPERPFTPRTLKKNTESRLKHSKCYNPPRSMHSSNRENKPEKVKAKSNKTQSPPASKKHQKDNDCSKNDLQETMGTTQLSDSTLMDVTLHSRDEAYGRNINHSVPPLAITMDKDHMNWLQEQASKAEVRVRSSGRLKSSLHPDEELHPRKNRSDQEENLRLEKLKKDEEQKYLAFAKEVTDDVLSRGISTDSVLYRVFENHIERRKHDLDEIHMRKVIKDLRKNLGLKDSLGKGQTLASLSESNYNNRFKKDLGVVNNSSGSHQQSISSTFAKEEDQKSHLNAPSEMNSTVESISTLKFGQTGDLLSTINSEASQEMKEVKQDRDDTESEMAGTQTLKQYQLSLAAKEERGDDNDSIQGSESGSAAVESGTRKNSLRQNSHVLGEKRQPEDDKSDTSSRRARKNSANDSQRQRHIETFQRASPNEISSTTSHFNSVLGNHEHSNEEISSIDRSVHNDTISHGDSIDNHNVQDDSDISLRSSEPSQRPVVKPRARARLVRHEAAQGTLDTTDADMVTEQALENKINSAMKSNQRHESSHSEKPGKDLAEAVVESVNTKEDVHKKGNDHQHHEQTTEEDEDYEEDYEEIIESEDDGQEDSADDF